MAKFDSPRRPAAIHGPAAHAWSLILGAVIGQREVRANRSALAALTDRDLADVGLERSDLDNAARRVRS